MESGDLVGCGGLVVGVVVSWGVVGLLPPKKTHMKNRILRRYLVNKNI